MWLRNNHYSHCKLFGKSNSDEGKSNTVITKRKGINGEDYMQTRSPFPLDFNNTLSPVRG
jgi:hypothetical protein